MQARSGKSVLFRRPGDCGDRRSLEEFARRLQKELAGGRPFVCMITHDAELRRLNRDFLGKDHATDVLSFPASPGTGPIGELAISAARARAQARQYGHRVDDELRILMLHGALHLIGMDHERDRGRMRRAESRWRKHFGLPNTLIERSLA
jgi:probable rRNA maturation factor